MNNLWQLIKINLLGFYGINKVRHSTDIEEKKKNKRQLNLAIVGMCAILYVAFYYGVILCDAFRVMHVEYLLIAMGILTSSLLTIMNMISKTNNYLFKFKDYDTISSLPIKNTTIVISRIILLYIMSIINVILFLVPFGIIYILAIKPSLYFYITFTITIFIVPLIPIIIGTFISTIISLISSKFKKSNIFNIIFTIIFILIVMYFSYSQNDKMAMYNYSNAIIKNISKIYPFLPMYMDGIIKKDIFEFIKIILISFILFISFSFIISKYFNKINTLLSSKSVKHKYKMKKLKESSISSTLLKKEFKRYFSSSMYVLNTGIGLILLVIASILLIFFGADKVGALLNIEGFSNVINSYAPLVLSVFVSLSCTTNSSISLEGKNFWIIKTLPIEEKDILKNKVLMNVLITIIPILISGTIINIYLKSNISFVILTYLIPLLYAFLIAQLGIIFNLYSNSFDWKNEVVVIKQSLPALLSTFLGIILSILPIVFLEKINLDKSLVLYIFVVILILVNSILYLFISNKGIKLFKQIEG